MESPNHSYIDALSGGDENFKAKLIAIIKAEFPEEKAIYQKNIIAGNLKNSAENVHKLKHKISILGLEKSYDVAVDFENNLLNNKIEGKEAFDAILESITDFLTTM